MPQITVEIRGLKELRDKLGAFSSKLRGALEAAGQEAGEEIVQSPGVAIYPPATAANMPPPPYYVRGVGMFYGKKYNYSSERYGTKFTVGERAAGIKGVIGEIKRYAAMAGGTYTTRIGNTASYGVYVGGDYQPAHMVAKGWRKVYDVAKEKIEKIKEIYQGWIDRLIAEVGLD